MEFMKGYKTVTGIVVYVLLSVLEQLSVVPVGTFTGILQSLAVGLGLWGAADKLERVAK